MDPELNKTSPLISDSFVNIYSFFFWKKTVIVCAVPRLILAVDNKRAYFWKKTTWVNAECRDASKNTLRTVRGLVHKKLVFLYEIFSQIGKHR